MPSSQIRQEVMKIVKSKKTGAALVAALKKAIQPSRIQNKKASAKKK